MLDPIFARLGVKMSARNFGMGGLGTLHNGVAAGAMYGRDVDIVMWDSSMTEKINAASILAIQSLVGMDRAPMLWFSKGGDKVLDQVHNVTGADVAVYSQPVFNHNVQTVEELDNIPLPLRSVHCPKVAKQYCQNLKYDGVCWIDRKNFEWEGMNLSHTPVTKQHAVPGGRASWHMGHWSHQIYARSFTFTILLAMRDVLKKWNEADDYVLDDKDWHVTEYYKSIKTKVVENANLWTYCEKAGISPKFCRYSVKGRTENTPRVLPWANSLRSIMAGSEHPNIRLLKNEYDPPDVYNPSLHKPKGEVDVLAIVENGVSFAKNLARIRDSARDMQGRNFDTASVGKGSKHNQDIVGGKGWSFAGGMAIAVDNCDGEHDSWCKRKGDCLMYGHNDERMYVCKTKRFFWLQPKERKSRNACHVVLYPCLLYLHLTSLLELLQKCCGYLFVVACSLMGTQVG